MTELLYRCCQAVDIPSMAEIRAADWGTTEYWQKRISDYLLNQTAPRAALVPRICFVPVDGERVVGLIAGHLTHRFGCDGELEWISVRREYRSRGVGSRLLYHLFDWFTSHAARRICVDVEPRDKAARRFYALHGAQDLRPSWMVWSDIRHPTSDWR